MSFHNFHEVALFAENEPPVAVALALIAALAMPQHQITITQAILVGLIATPIAPVAKDIASAITTAGKAMQSLGA